MSETPDSAGESRIPAGNRREAEAISLVLAAEGIAHRVANDEGRWSVALDPVDRARADGALLIYKSENAPPPAPPPELEPEIDTLAGLWLAGALVAIYAYTGDWANGGAPFDAGANDARLVVAGEWWRCLTALTLHADWSHVLGNAFSCAVFATLLMRRHGAGLGLLLLVTSGAVGNLLSAEWYRAHSSSVGFSTALFGAIGALASTELARRQRGRARASQVWLPLAGGVALLAMLGTSRGSDLAAHSFGLGAGVLIGYAAVRVTPRPPGAALQLALASVTVAAVALAWRRALAGG
ncbi:MAG TPA: rhomboid family intramembrane serine protease [Myxococcota bacterium]|nr:rhomboid family intramembrane serine protease [Myxococcota bacterium]